MAPRGGTGFMAPRGGTEFWRLEHALNQQERPRPRPTGIVNDSTWTGRDPRQKIGERVIEGGFLNRAQARSVCYFVLIRAGYRGVHELANMTEKLAFFSGLRSRAQEFAPRSSGKPRP
jgi:hypothetical protein